MDVWKLNKKLIEQTRTMDFLVARVAKIESFLSQITAKDSDENVQSKKTRSSGVRTKRSSTKKS